MLDQVILPVRTRRMPKKPDAEGKKRTDESTKIDSWVLFMARAVVNWRKHTNAADENLTVAEYLSELVRALVAKEYAKAAKWMSEQNDKGPKPKPGTED